MFPVSETCCPPTSHGGTQNRFEVKLKLCIGLLLALCGREKCILVNQRTQRSGLPATNHKHTCIQHLFNVCTWKSALFCHSLEAQKGYSFDSESPEQAKSQLYKTMTFQYKGILSICCRIKNTASYNRESFGQIHSEESLSIKSCIRKGNEREREFCIQS